MSFKETLKNLGTAVCKNSPTILTVTSIVLGCATVVAAVKAAPTVVHKVDEEVFNARPDEDPIDDPDLGEVERKVKHLVYKIDMCDNGVRKSQIVKAVWKDCIWVGIFGAGAIASGVAAHIISLRRCVEMASMYKLMESRNDILKEKIVEVVGPKKAEEIEKKATAEEITRTVNIAGGLENIPLYGKGSHDTIFQDHMTGQIFLSNWLAVENNIKDLESIITDEGSLDFGDYLDSFNLKKAGICNYAKFLQSDRCKNEWYIRISETTDIPELMRPAYVIRTNLRFLEDDYYRI